MVQVLAAPRMGRALRNPQHPFHLRHRPFQIQPFLLAPVLPGETLKNALMQARVVTDPIKNPLIGWWIEYYYFYVKLRDMAGRDDFVDMLIDPTKSISSYNTAAKVEHYHYGTAVDWVDQCMKAVCDGNAGYFRNEGEAWNVATIGNLPAAGINSQSYLDSAINDSAYVRPDVNVDLNANATITASEVDTALRQFQWLRSNGLTDQTYEDYLATYGIKVETTETHVPELVRYVREWSYPSNTVNPSTGVPSSAVSWSIQERADKDRFFKEPGFLFGVTIARPKVYMSGTKGNAASLLTDAIAWLPAVLDYNPITSMKKVAATTNPLSGNTGAYWVDLRDLYLYGDQFVNFALTDTAAGLVALPTAGLQKRYPSSADVDALFSAASPANQVRQDGVVRLSIATRLREQTATV